MPGDRVISIDGIAVDDVTTLQARLDDKNVGDVVVLLVERAGKTREMLGGTTTGSLMESGSWICTAKQPSDFSLAPNYEPQLVQWGRLFRLNGYKGVILIVFPDYP